jgi:anaerobic magnesium-protoporphyrin IX monomethyl ester cyclase
MIDVLFITPNNSKGIYQKLSNKYSSIETPTWSLLLAESCRSVGFKVAILDTTAEQLTDEEAYKKILEYKPKLLCFVVYGQNVNAGTTNMSGAVRLSNYLKNKKLETLISFIGSHVQSLPIKTINDEKSIDFVFTNEGVYSLREILSLKKITLDTIQNIKGICFLKNKKPFMTPPQKIVPQDKMDIDLPGYAWDLLPYKSKPLDLYRAPMWHAEYDENKRTPYAALQTSLGCKFGCNFCMINIINRDDNNEIGVASDYSHMRWWSTDFIIKEFDKLINMGVRTIRIVDEMFMLNPKYYIPLCEKLVERNLNDKLRMWAYSRVDTIKSVETLNLVRKAGIKWLCLGIESSSKEVRLEVSKGKFEDVDIKEVVKRVHEADIDIMANYIFGLPGDNMKKMKQTLDLSMELNTRGWNAYAAMALPGSELYREAIQKKLPLPDSYEGYSFHAYETQPLPTEHLSAAEILEYRDQSFIKYHSNQNFLIKIENKFGTKAVNTIKEINKIKLKRKILEKSN